jgi:anti-sigma factor RsiW
MSEHIDLWLDVYVDGELSAEQRQRVNTHLLQCDRCRCLVAQRKSLSTTLQDMPAVHGLKSETRFVAEIGLQMGDRRSVLSPNLTSWLWYLVPLTLLLAVVFIQTVTLLTTAVSAFPEANQVLQGSMSVMQSTLAIPLLTGTTFEMVSGIGILDWGWAAGLISLAVIGILYVSWLAGWLVWRQQYE